MRRLIDRISLLTAGLAVAILVVVVSGSAWYLSHERPDQAFSLDESYPSLWVARLVALLAVLGGASVVLAMLATLPLRRRHASCTDLLVRQARRFTAGETRLSPLHTGVEEFDLISEVLTRQAHDMTRSLAAERDFAADASHQLRTPLTALLMRLEEISATDDATVVKEEATIAITQVERLTRVVDDLLGRSRGANGPTPSVSLDSVIAALQREWQPAFEKARRSVRVHGERGLFVRSTPIALSQVLSTLFENSLAHGRGTVDVQARRSGPSVVVEVSDEGDGVPATMAAHIFERSVSGGARGSTGLGLALARDLAEANGGRLDLVQAQPARFALFLSEAEDR
ncbi:MAG: HAMP domain-containing histidine kinase [Micrococcales bacterium]|nr:HAMP domain-containing histidine kinase [Micrococcales bacterium]